MCCDFYKLGMRVPALQNHLLGNQIVVNRGKSSLIVENQDSHQPSNARRSNQAAPCHPAFPSCAVRAFLRPISLFRIGPFANSCLIHIWVTHPQPPFHGRSGRGADFCPTPHGNGARSAGAPARPRLRDGRRAVIWCILQYPQGRTCIRKNTPGDETGGGRRSQP